jgi:endoglucanase
VIARIQVIVGEIGENDCADGYIDPLMSYLDFKSASRLAWSWNADFNCSASLSLITSYSGTPTS